MSRKKHSEKTAPRKRLSRAARAQLAELRVEFRTVIAKLKALGFVDSMVLVEFWHALDCVNGEDCGEG